MRVPWRRRGACSALLAASVSSTGAQMLDLGGPAGPPRPGEGVVWIDRAAELRAEARALRPEQPALDPITDAESALRTLAAALLERGEALGPDGGAHTIAGLTIDTRRGALRAELDRIGAPSALVLARRARARAAALPENASALAAEMREIMAMLVTGADANTPARALAGDLDAWARSGALSDGGLAAARRLDAELLAAGGLPGYAPSAERIASVVGAAGDGVTPPPWLAPDAADALRAAFERALLELAPPEAGVEIAPDRAAERRRALEAMRRVALVAEATAALDAMGDDAGVAAARTTWSDALAGDTTGDTTAERARAVLRVAALLTPEREPEGEGALLQPLRPAHRALVRERRDATRRLLDALPRLVADPALMADPSVAGVLGAMRGLLRSFDDLAALNATCSRWSREDAPVRGPRLAVRALELSRGLEGGRSRAEYDAALARVRRLAADADAFADLHARARLGGTAFPGDADRLGAVFDRAAGDLFGAWLDDAALDEVGEARGRAAVLADLADRLADLDACRRAERDSAFLADPMLEAPPDAVRALADRAERDLTPALRFALAGEIERAGARLQDPGTPLDAARLLRGLWPAETPATHGPADELTRLTGLAADTERAEACRYLVEVAILTERAEPIGERLAQHVRALAERHAPTAR